MEKIKKVVEKMDRKYIQLFPFIFTYANAIFGFISVLYALHGRYTLAAVCLLAACFMDFCDGRVARALHATTLLGAELDSLCDAVSFCFAPAILLYSYFSSVSSFLFLLSLICYLLCGLYRLAKFNTLEDKNSCFIGLPTPVAAVFIAQLVLYQQLFQCYFLQNVVFVSVIVLLIAGFMISPIRIPSCK